MEKVVEVKNLRKVFKSEKKKFFKVIEKKEFVAVDGVDFFIKKGEIFGLLGPNGAGKTTTIKMITGLLRPSSGEVTVNGINVDKEPIRALKEIGTVLAGDRSVYWKLTARENLEYFGSLYGLSSKEAKEKTTVILEKLGLTEKADITVEKFSTGMKQKVALGKALIPNASLILLDEPTLGLDPQSAINLREIITELKNEGKTILLTTHYMEEADILCDRIAIVDNGKIIALDTSDNLKASISEIKTIKALINEISEKRREELIASLKEIDDVTLVTSSSVEDKGALEITVQHKGTDLMVQSVIDVLVKRKYSIRNIDVPIASLEDVFINLTGKSLRE
ncbi:MAG: ABC transporter ATP-binding protein [Clostridium sp.]